MGAVLLSRSTHGSHESFVPFDVRYLLNIEYFLNGRGTPCCDRDGVSVAGPSSCLIDITACFYTYPHIKAPRLHFFPPHTHTSHPKSRDRMQGPTLTDLRVRNTRDSHIIFEAVARRILPLITRRLTSIERRECIRPGSVFVWEERGPESGSSGVRGRHWFPTPRILTPPVINLLSFRQALNVGQMVNFRAAILILRMVSHVRKSNRQAMGTVPGQRRKRGCVPVI